MFIDSIGVSVLTSRLFSGGFKTSRVLCQHRQLYRFLLLHFHGVFRFSPSPLSRLFNTSFARRTTLSGTPASFATSMPKLSSAPPRTIRRRNVMSSRCFSPHTEVLHTGQKVFQLRQLVVMRRKQRLRTAHLFVVYVFDDRPRNAHAVNVPGAAARSPSKISKALSSWRSSKFPPPRPFPHLPNVDCPAVQGRQKRPRACRCRPQCRSPQRSPGNSSRSAP